MWEYQSVAENKQTEIQLDTPVIPRWACSLSKGATAKKKKPTLLSSSSAILTLQFYPQYQTAETQEEISNKPQHKSRFRQREEREAKKKHNNNRFVKHPKFLKFAQEKTKRGASHNVFVWITYSFIPLNSCHPKVISIIMVSILPNGILAVIMYASVLCRHYQPCHPELHKCNYTKPLITKQYNLLLEWKYILASYDSNYTLKGKYMRTIGGMLRRKMCPL